jgi:hypothetical protein
VDRITAMRVAGHVTAKMWDKYSQVRFDSVREKLTETFRSSNPGRLNANLLLTSA